MLHFSLPLTVKDMPMRKIFLVSLLVMLPSWLWAQRCLMLSVGDGLCSSNVNALYQDRRGDIWIATENGLNRYDGLYVHTYKHNPSDPHSLSHNIIRSFAEDGQGRLFVGGELGVQYYDPGTDSFSILLADENGEPYTGYVNHMIAVEGQTVWLSGNLLQRLSGGTLEEPVLTHPRLPIPTRMTGTLQCDENGTLWVARHGNGIYRWDADGQWKHYLPDCFEDLFVTISNPVDGVIYAADHSGNICHLDAGTDSFIPDASGLEGFSIFQILNLGDGRILFCTDGHGVRVLDTATGEWTLLKSDTIPCDPATMSVHSILKDRSGNLWLAAYQQGVVMIPARDIVFHYLGNRSFVSNVIGSMPVSSLLAEPDGKLWVGTSGDGLYLLDEHRSQLKHYRVEDGFPSIIFDLTKDRDGMLWFGSFSRGLWCLDPGKGLLVNTAGHDKDDHAVEIPRSLELDNSGRFWIGSMGYGLSCYDPVLHSRERIVTSGETINPRVSDLLVLDDNLFVATAKGIYHLNISSTQRSVLHHVLPETQVYCLASDGEDLYAGTIDGMAVIDTGTFQSSMITMADGLPDNAVYSIEVTSDGLLWISTSSRLVRFNPRSGSIRYSDEDLLVEEFLRNVSTAGPDGNLYFGGTEGVTYFKPSDIFVPASLPQAKIVSFSVPGRRVPLNENGYYELDHTEHVCTISFTVADFVGTSGLRFVYSVDGKEWTELDRGQTSITLGNLRPGRFQFRVKTNIGEADTIADSISIYVHHSPWASAPAIGLYCLLGLLLLGYVALLSYRAYQSQKKAEQYAREKSLKEEKLNFFLSLSHEIRSPMTLVKAPLQKLKETDPDPERQRAYALIGRNADNVLHILDQTLDLSKADEDAIKLSFSPISLVEFVSSICELFRPQAENNGQRLLFRYACSRDLEVWLDRSYFNKVIVNLLSNALKYTPSGGSIQVTVSSLADTASVEVKDNGVGIDKNSLQQVFDLFYQSPDAISGTGIGLFFAKTITELHHGTIRADNLPDGGGAVFTVTLPLGNAHLSEAELEEKGTEKENPMEPAAVQPEGPDGRQEKKGRPRHTVLIVEDNSEIRHWLATEFSSLYRILEADNGKDAYGKALSEHPDLVVSDVIMPGMDGFELCARIRKNPNISSLPIILLTARTLDRDKIEGMESGADAYITKPFNIEVLKTTMDSLIRGRERLKVTLAGPKVDERDIREPEIKTPDDRLLERIVRVVNEHLGEADLTVEQVAAEVGVSRVHLHRKLRELTGETSRDFIRNLRLRKAAEMLSEKKYAISELADAVGFRSASSFTTAFKTLFGVSPSEYGHGKNEVVT